MSDIKWIKLATDIFDNRKIKQIRKLPDGSDICLMWFQLMCLAGTINDYGQIYITPDIPYTEETLATEFDLPIQTVKLGLKVFEQFGMIEVIDDILRLSSWERYQNVEKLEKYREYQRNYQREYRAKQKALEDHQDERKDLRKCLCKDLCKSNVNPTDKDIDIDEDIDKDIEKDTEKERDTKPVRHKYGEYQNVLLSDEDMQKLQNEFPNDWQERIERLSSYVASTGKSYKNHLATIRNWARKEGSERENKKTVSVYDSRKGSYFQPTQRSMSYAEYQAAAVAVDEEDEELPFVKENR